MGNDYSMQRTYACCETCVRKGNPHKIEFLSTGTPHVDDCKNTWIEVRYKCSNNHLFYTKELKSNYFSRVERHNAQINEINSLKKKVAELEEIIRQNNMQPASAPQLVIAECISPNIMDK